MVEHWKQIKGYEDYLVSDLGFVRSNKFGRQKNLIPYINSKYYYVNFSENGVVKGFTIHSLVAQAFLNHKIGGYKLVVDHIDKDTLNNEVSNLRLITHRENVSRTNTGTSKYIGVHWCRTIRRWKSKIQIDKKLIHLGCFKNEYDAHLAYQNKLKTINYAKIPPGQMG